METTVSERTRALDVEMEPSSVGGLLAPGHGSPEPQPVRRAEVVRQLGGATSAATDSALNVMASSPALDQLFAALAEAQSAPNYGDIEKTKTARVQSRKGEGSSYTYEYETMKDVLDAVLPHWSKVGLALLQLPFLRSGTVQIRTIITHKSGQWLSNDLVVPTAVTDPQSLGSAISYLRRYALKSVAGVSSHEDDDDGATASGHRPDTSAPQPAQRKSQQQAPAAQATVAPAATGKVKEVTERGGNYFVTLDTGFVAGVRDPELIDGAKKLVGKDTVVELICRPPSSPKYVPVLLEIQLEVAR